MDLNHYMLVANYKDPTVYIIHRDATIESVKATNLEDAKNKARKIARKKGWDLKPIPQRRVT